MLNVVSCIYTLSVELIAGVFDNLLDFLAAMVGLLGAAGGFMPLTRNEFDFSKSGTVAGAMMIVLSVAFVGLCVKSFIDARKARKAAGGV